MDLTRPQRVREDNATRGVGLPSREPNKAQPPNQPIPCKYASHNSGWLGCLLESPTRRSRQINQPSASTRLCKAQPAANPEQVQLLKILLKSFGYPMCAKSCAPGVAEKERLHVKPFDKSVLKNSLINRSIWLTVHSFPAVLAVIG